MLNLCSKWKKQLHLVGNWTGVDLGYILHFTSDSKGSKQWNIHSIAGPKSNHVEFGIKRHCRLTPWLHWQFLSHGHLRLPCLLPLQRACGAGASARVRLVSGCPRCGAPPVASPEFVPLCFLAFSGSFLFPRTRLLLFLFFFGWGPNSSQVGNYV